ncbi:MAG TPA: SusC/RagA family TonB-linked outer membrane protein [Cyclobacteriaceae bacterium]|nr:SusC/RagA family TonB-linked outer membrane protein [Cyclobacteriaceae bacterium]
MKFYRSILLSLYFMCLLTTIALAQSRVVSGSVKDPSGAALPGVTIQVKGTASGTVSDGEGKYTVNVEGQSAVIVFSFIGFSSQEVQVGAQSVIDVTMKEDATQLQEVVVTALGLEKDRKSLSYALQEVSGDKLTTVPDANLMNSLAGKVAGIQINRSASGVGGSTRVVLRGPKSTRENSVLYVIDGIAMPNYSPEQPSDIWGQSSGAGSGGRDAGDGISNINPNDIESINVLKGASAAALYGSAAANGVILINTKKGKAGQTKIDISSDLTAESVLLRPELQFKYGQTTPPIASGQPGGPAAGSEQSWGSAVNAPDHVKGFFQTGRTWINSVSISGGTEKAQAYFSYANTDNQGIIPTSTFKRHTLNFRESIKFSERLSLDASVNVITQKAHNRAVSGLYNNPLTGLYMMPRGLDFNNYKNNIEYFDVSRNVNLQNWWNINNSLGFAGSDYQQNPYWAIQRNLRDDGRDRLFGAVTLKYKLNGWLTAQARGRFDKSWDTYTLQSYAGTQSVLAAPDGRFTWQKFENSQIYGDFLLLANKQLSNDLGFSGTIGTNITDYKASGLILDTNPTDPQGLLYANFFTVQNIAPSALLSTQSYTRKQVQSVLGNAQLTYKDRLTVDLSARNDWSSSFANTSAMKSGYLYYSAGLSGVVSEMVKLPEAISFAKARVSFAKVGNDVPATYTDPRNGSVNGGKFSQATAYPYPGSQLVPEDNRSFEAGAELKFIEGRVGLDFTFFQNDNFKQYVTFPAPASSGYSSYYKNVGHIRNRGIEISLNIVPVKNENLTWSSTFNFSHYKNTIVNLSDNVVSSSNGYTLTDFGVNMYSTRLVEGGSWGDLYSNKVFQRATDGSIIVDATGTPQTTVLQGNYKKIGSIIPNYQLGWYNSFEIKGGFNVGLLIDGRFGGQVLSITQAMLDQYGYSKATGDARDKGTVNVKARLNSDNSVFTYTSSTVQNYFSGVGGRAGVAEAYIYDATNIRVREFSVGYNLPLKISGVRNIRVSLIGRNLFFLMKNAPFDPDVALATGNGLQGVDSFGLPSLRSIGGSIKIGL